MSNRLYVLGDADQIRRRIEGLLLSNKLRELGEFSSNISAAIKSIESGVKARMNADVVFCGGDDIFFVVDEAAFREEDLASLGHSFANRTGSSISFGVGRSAEEAFLNLSRAKSIGSGAIILS